MISEILPTAIPPLGLFDIAKSNNVDPVDTKSLQTYSNPYLLKSSSNASDALSAVATVSCNVEEVDLVDSSFLSPLSSSSSEGFNHSCNTLANSS